MAQQQLDLHEKVVLADLEPSHCVPPGTSVRQVLSQLKQNSGGSCLICEGERLVGIFTERDALRLFASGANLDQPIEKVMCSTPKTARASDTIASAIEKMARGGYRRLPVLDDAGRPLGVISVAGIVHYLCQHFPRFVYNLPPNPNQTMAERHGA